MKFKLQNWLLGFLIFLTLVPSWVFAYIPKNTRQGSEGVFSISLPETSRENSELQPVSRSLAQKIATAPLFMLKDGLGSTIALTGRDGKAIAHIGYDAWGNFRYVGKDCKSPCNDDDFDNYLDRLEGIRGFGYSNHNGWAFGKHFGSKLTPYLYTGRRYSPFTGQYNNRNRYYSPALGRFVSKDPIGFAADVNLYRYVGNNPVVYIDSYGENPLLWGAAGIAGLGALGEWLIPALNNPNNNNSNGNKDLGKAIDKAAEGFSNAAEYINRDVRRALDPGGINRMDDLCELLNRPLQSNGNSSGRGNNSYSGESGSPNGPDGPDKGKGPSRRKAFRDAKRKNNIPTSQSPSRVKPNTNRQGKSQPGRQYEFDNPSGKKVIRDDAAGHKYPDNPSQNRGSHFNDEFGNHFDYEP